MKKIIYLLSAGMLLSVCIACKEKKETPEYNIILPKVPHEVVDTIVGVMPETESTTEVTWGGKYKVYVHREPADSMDLVTMSDGKKYKDNRIKIRITREDGSVFFDRVFTKNAFASYLDNDYKEKSTLLGLVYYSLDKSNLYFAGSVGSPDMMSDDFIPFRVSISRMGDVGIQQETVIDVEIDEPDSIQDNGQTPI